MCQLLHNVPSRGNAGLGEPLATWVFGVWISSAYLMTIKTEKRRLGLSYYQIRRETWQNDAGSTILKLKARPNLNRSNRIVGWHVAKSPYWEVAMSWLT